MAPPQPSRPFPKAAILAGGAALAALLVAALVVLAGGGDDDKESANEGATQVDVVAEEPVSVPTATAALVPAGDVEGTFEHTVTAMSGDCSALRLPSGPVAVGTALPATTARWGIGAADAAGMHMIRSSSALTGSLNPTSLAFTVATPDNASSGSGTFSRDGTSFSGKSVFKFGASCTLETNSTARFVGPLFSFSAGAAGQVAAPTPVAAAPTSPPPAPASAPAPPAPTAVPAPDIPSLIRAAVEGEYTEANRAGNGNYMVAHLHPSAPAFYGAAACQDFFSRLGADPTFTVRVNGISGPAPWTWQIYGETVGTIPDAYTVDVVLTQQGRTINASVHFAWDNASGLRVFSPCRRPPA
jgi:hypothetical protein